MKRVFCFCSVLLLLLIPLAGAAADAWPTAQELFERDPAIHVGEIVEPEDGSADYLFDIEVRDHSDTRQVCTFGETKVRSLSR